MVLKEGGEDDKQKVGLVISCDAKERTAKVRWFDKGLNRVEVRAVVDICAYSYC